MIGTPYSGASLKKSIKGTDGLILASLVHNSLALTDVTCSSLASDKYFIYIDKVKICNPFSEQLTRVLSWKPERQ